MTDAGSGTTPVRVAHLCPTFSPLSETFIYDKVTELERQGVEGSVVTFRRFLPEDRPFPRVATPSGIERTVLRARRAAGMLASDHPTMLLRNMEVHRRIVRDLLQRVGPVDLIHAHFGSIGVMAAPLARERAIPLVVGFYGFDVGQLPRYPEWRTAYDALWPQADRIVVLSRDMARRLAALGCPDELLEVVHLTAPRDVGSVESLHPPRRWLSVGRLVEKKGHADALQAFSRVAPRFPDLTFTLIGEGPLRRGLEDTVAESGLEGRVRLLGAQPRGVVLAEMRRAQAFVLCSRTAESGDEEGTPTTLIEAAAVGLPCISTRHAGIPEVIAETNHDLLAPEGDVAAIASVMERVAGATADEMRRRSEAGRRHAQTHFDLATETRRLAALYQAVGGRMRG